MWGLFDIFVYCLKDCHWHSTLSLIQHSAPRYQAGEHPASWWIWGEWLLIKIQTCIRLAVSGCLDLSAESSKLKIIAIRRMKLLTYDVTRLFNLFCRTPWWNCATSDLQKSMMETCLLPVSLPTTFRLRWARFIVSLCYAISRFFGVWSSAVYVRLHPLWRPLVNAFVNLQQELERSQEVAAHWHLTVCAVIDQFWLLF